MANRKNTFLVKRSNVAGKIPAAGDLLLGELALNTADGILYASGTTANSILQIGWNRVARTGDTMTGSLFTPYLSATTVSASSLTLNGNLTVTGNTQSIFSGNTSSDLVRITQTGSGNAFVVEDSNNPDTTKFVVDSNGDVGINITSNTSYKLNVSGDSIAVRGVGFIGVQGYAGAASNNYGVNGVVDGAGAGVFGWNYYGAGFGVQGRANGGIGVQGYGGIVGGKFEGTSDGSPIGVYGYVTDIDGGGTDYIAGKFEAAGGTTRYSVQLKDGSQGINKVLVSQTSDGKANWSSILSGLTGVYSNTVSATTYYNLPSLSGDYLPLSGGTVYGPTTYTGGLTANTLNVTGLTQTSGITSTGGIILPHKTLTTNYTATTADYFLNVSGDTLDVFLMTAVDVEGKLLVVKNEGSGIVNVISQFGELIDDRNDVLLTQGNSVQLVSDGVNWAILGYNISSTQANTGVVSFSGLSKVSNSTFYVAPVQGYIVDDTTNPTIPFLTFVQYTGGTHTDDYYTTAFETFVYVTSGGTIGQQPTPLTAKQRRQNIFLGKLGHPDKTAINLVFSQPDYILTPLGQLRDMFIPINLINGGVYPSASTGLTINTSAGNIYGLGINFIGDKLNPNTLSISGQSPCTFQYRTSTGGTVTNTTLVDPLNYDLNGVITPLGGTKATNQRIYLLQNGSFRIMYGQHVYANFAEAVQNLQTETFTPFPNFVNNAVLICVLTILSSATDLTDTSKAQFFFASKFGETVGAVGGVSTTNLQQAYNNSSNPEIIINSILDGLTIKNGTGNADNIIHLLQGMNAAGNVTSFIRADGDISGTTLQTNGFTGNSTGMSAITVSATTIKTPSFTANNGGITATTVYTNTISATTYYNLPIDIFVTGGTYSTGTATFTNNTGGTFTVTGFSDGGGSVFTGGTVTGPTIFTSGLSANTISATTIYGTDLTVSGGTQSWFSGNSASDLVRITQTGAGNALVVEDENSPDTSRFVVDATGNVGIGTNSPITKLQISNTATTVSSNLYNTTNDFVTLTAQGSSPGFNIISAGDAETNRGVFKATRSRGTLTTPLVPILNDDTLSLVGAIYDGITNLTTAGITFDVDGTVTSGVAPQRMVFSTGTGSSRTERIRYCVKGK